MGVAEASVTKSKRSTSASTAARDARASTHWPSTRYALVDGIKAADYRPRRAIIAGDALEPRSAASILAKTARDR